MSDREMSATGRPERECITLSATGGPSANMLR